MMVTKAEKKAEAAADRADEAAERAADDAAADRVPANQPTPPVDKEPKVVKAAADPEVSALKEKAARLERELAAAKLAPAEVPPVEPVFQEFPKHVTSKKTKITLEFATRAEQDKAGPEFAD